MGLREELEKVLPEDLMQQVDEAAGDEFDWECGMVSKRRLNQALRQRNKARRDLSDLELELEATEPPKTKTKTKQKDPEDDPKPGDTTIETLQVQHQKELDNLKLQFAAIEKLRENKAIDPKLILKSGLIDVEQLAFNDKGELTGLDDQLPGLQESKGFLFKLEDDVPPGTGKKGGGDTFTQITSMDKFMELSTADQIKFKETNPEVFKQFKQEGIW